MVQADGIGILNLLASYAQSCDDDLFDDFQALFKDDAIMTVAGTSLVGAQDIRAFVEEQQRAGLQGKHLIGNVRLVVDGDNATVSSDFFFFQWRDGRLQVTRSGRYDDVLGRVDHDWRFERHDVTFFQRDAMTPTTKAI